MKIVKTFDQINDNLIDEKLIQNCQKGKWFHWKRTFFLRTDGKIAVISLNLFERIAWSLETFFRGNYSKFESFFKTKNIKMISPSDLNQTEKKANDQFHKNTSNQTNEKEKVQPSPIENQPEKSEPEINKNDENSEQKKPQSLPIDKHPIQENKKEKEQPDPNNNDVVTKTPILTPTQIVQNFIKNGQLDEAIKANEKLSQYDNTKTTLYCEIAKAYSTQGKLQEATDILSKDHVRPFREMTSPVYCDIAKAYFSQDKIQEATDILSDKVFDRDKTRSIYEEFAQSCCQKRKYAEAKKCLEKISYEKDFAKDFFLKLVKEHNQNKDYDKALEILVYITDSLDIYTSEIQDLFPSIAIEYMSQGELDKAVIAIDKIANAEKRYTLFTTLSESYFQKKEYEKALDYNIFNENFGACKAFYIKIADIYRTEGKNEEALDVLNRIVKHGKLVDNKHIALVKDYLKERNYKMALEGIMRSSIKETYW